MWSDRVAPILSTVEKQVQRVGHGGGCGSLAESSNARRAHSNQKQIVLAWATRFPRRASTVWQNSCNRSRCEEGGMRRSGRLHIVGQAHRDHAGFQASALPKDKFVSRQGSIHVQGHVWKGCCLSEPRRGIVTLIQRAGLAVDTRSRSKLARMTFRQYLRIATVSWQPLARMQIWQCAAGPGGLDTAFSWYCLRWKRLHPSLTPCRQLPWGPLVVVV